MAKQIIYCVTPARIQGKRISRTELLSKAPFIGHIAIHFEPSQDSKGQQVLTLSDPEMRAGQKPVLGALYDPEFLTFTGNVFFVRGIERFESGHEYVQEWWGRITET